MKTLGLLLGLAVILAYAGLSSANGRKHARVSRVIDGDSVKVVLDGKLENVRLACIDAPELSQKPWGESARNNLASYLHTADDIELEIKERDMYGRIVAEIYERGKNVNLKQLKDGSAVVYAQYLKACSDNREEYITLESRAKYARLGFWNQDNIELPHQYRSRKNAR